MPSITTHHYFAKEVYNALTKEEKSFLGKNLPIYYAFAQSHDYLFYYTFDIKNAKKIKELGHYAHHNNTQDYLINIVKLIKEKNLEYNEQAICYLYGSITHYCLDSICHPYIFYKTGIYRKNNPNSLKYRGEHTHMEKDLDAIYYKKFTNKAYNHCKINKEIIKNPIFSKELLSLISNTYKKTYNKDNIGIIYQKAIKHAKIINYFIFNDKFGIKKAIFKRIDKLTNKKFGYLEGYSNYNLKPNTNYLNLDHKIWNHPSNKEITYAYSFEDLFNISLKKAIDIIKEVNKVLYKNKSITILKKAIPNLDYATGVSIKDSCRMDYFE